MFITGLTQSQIADAVSVANKSYAGNIVIERLEATSGSGIRHNLKLGVANSRVAGARRSGSGRHGKWLCWHGFRDVIRAMMVTNPDTVVRSSQAVYRGSDDFENVYPDTAYVNVGSLFQPSYLAENCVGECAGQAY